MKGLMGEKGLYLRTRSWGMNIERFTRMVFDVLETTWDGLSFKVKIKVH